MTSRWDSWVTLTWPFPVWWARVIPPTARVPKTIANTLRRMTRPPLEPRRFRHSATRTLGVGRFVTGRAFLSRRPPPGTRLEAPGVTLDGVTRGRRPPRERDVFGQPRVRSSRPANTQAAHRHGKRD